MRGIEGGHQLSTSACKLHVNVFYVTCTESYSKKICIVNHEFKRLKSLEDENYQANNHH